MNVQIYEVGPRDGLQNEAKGISVAARVEFVRRLAAAGLKRVEIGAFVSAKWVPQMQGSAEVIAELSPALATKNIRLSALVPNAFGMNEAIRSGLREVAVFGACSEQFSQKNINCTIAESFVRFAEVMKLARAHKIKVRGYLSMAFGCPYEGIVPEAQVVKLVQQMIKLGTYEVSLGDTIGVATPRQVRSLLKKLRRYVPVRKLALHFHDTRGTALANVLAGLEEGVGVFDSCLGGLGGCPYAVGASGNLATEDLVYMLEGMGIKTGIDLNQLIPIKSYMEEQIGRKLPSHVGAAGLPRQPTLNFARSLFQSS